MLLPPRNVPSLRRAALLILLPAFLILSSPDAGAQKAGSMGDDFWITFLPNHGSEGDEEVLDPHLHIVSDRAASVTVTSIESGAAHVVALGPPSFTIDVDLGNVFNDAVELEDAAGSSTISRRSFHITATTDVAVMAMSLKFRSADAFTALPAGLLGAHYYVLGYRNGRGFTAVADMPSEFAVVATEDNTTITISPRMGNPHRGHGDAPFPVTLDRGEVFLGQAETGIDADLSGTEIVASAPVALFGGCKRTSIPTPVGNYRDFIVEQLPPVSTWGREFLVAPTVEPSWLSRDTNRLRILAGRNGATINVEHLSGTSEVLLQPGAFFEMPVTGPMAIRSTWPVLTAFYQHSVNAETELTDTVTALRGDPFMVLVPPVEWFDSIYHVVAPPASVFGSSHYANVILPETAIRSVRVDGELANVLYRRIPWTQYYYAQLKLAPGAHVITAASPFGLTVYGFGDMISYGYLGGMRATNATQGVESPDVSSGMSLAVAGDPSQGISCSLDLLLERPARVRIELFDLRGTIVRHILDENHLDAGAHSIPVDLSALPSGLYLCRAVTAAGASSDARIVVAR